MNLADFKFQKSINTIKPTQGPFFSRDPEKIMKRAIRGMLPDYRLGRGREAWRRVKCYQGVPEKFKKEKEEFAKKMTAAGRDRALCVCKIFFRKPSDWN